MKRDGFYMRIWKLLYPMFTIMGFVELASIVYMFFVYVLGSTRGYKINSDILLESIYFNNMVLVGIGQLTATIWLIYFYQKDKAVIHITPSKANILSVLILIVMSISACIGINFTMDTLRFNVIFEATSEELGSLLYSGPLWVQLIVMVVIAPIAEELTFRGLIFKRMRTYMKFVPASLLTAILFGLYHGNVLQFIYAFIISWILTLVYEQFLSIKYCILVHGCLNLVSVLASSTKLLVWIPVTGWKYLAVTFAADMITILCVLLLLGPLAPKQGESKPQSGGGMEQ